MGQLQTANIGCTRAARLKTKLPRGEKNHTIMNTTVAAKAYQ